MSRAKCDTCPFSSEQHYLGAMVTQINSYATWDLAIKPKKISLGAKNADMFYVLVYENKI